MVGKTLGHYRILEELGSGGMGVVYLAEDEKLQRKVALKVLPFDAAHSPERRKRFEREARSVAALSHANILSIHDFGEDGGILFAVTELLEGENLRESLKRVPLSPHEALDYARQIAAGLDAAHARGIVHRDLKPENLFLTREGRIKILDFGLAKDAPTEGVGDDTPTESRATEPGTVLGTIGYMSPEQVRGREADARSDIFSFGAVLYEILSGRRAFVGESDAVVMSAILRDEPPELTASPLARVVSRCLDKHPERRFQSARELALALERIGESETNEAPPFLKGEPLAEEDERPVFVGRERALLWLSGALQSAVAGTGQLVLVGGAAGQGKSTLLQEFTRRAPCGG